MLSGNELSKNLFVPQSEVESDKRNYGKSKMLNPKLLISNSYPNIENRSNSDSFDLENDFSGTDPSQDIDTDKISSKYEFWTILHTECGDQRQETESLIFDRDPMESSIQKCQMQSITIQDQIIGIQNFHTY